MVKTIKLEWLIGKYGSERKEERGGWLMLLALRQQERSPKSQYVPLGRYSRR
ncbi:hypothetical protein [Paenibacillus polymyxa]|uniref:hypothetical protein n=1 Tax=Paenibacillus polymyxa TaxID=1406 RepID=UPI0004B467FD|nr:hypothetical protein [Paenibacillus polymyxa]